MPVFANGFFDHHAHSLLRQQRELDVLGFRACWTESRSPEIIAKHVPEQINYQSMLSELTSLLGVDGEDGLVALRSRIGESEYVRLLWDDAEIKELIVDDGFGSEKMLSIEELEKLANRPVHQCRRIESVLERCISTTESFAELRSLFEKELTSDKPRRPVALKTILGYRGGLTLDIVTQADAEKDYSATKEQFSQGNTRIHRRPLYHFLLMQAFEIAACHGLPVQVHTGLGDDDQDLISVNPALLQPLFRMPTLQQTNFMLLHCFPYVREAGLLCGLYPNVFMDLSLAINHVSLLADDLVKEAYACAPPTKIVGATDGHSIPETHWFAATRWNETVKRLHMPFYECELFKERLPATP